MAGEERGRARSRVSSLAGAQPRSSTENLRSRVRFSAPPPGASPPRPETAPQRHQGAHLVTGALAREGEGGREEWFGQASRSSGLRCRRGKRRGPLRDGRVGGVLRGGERGARWREGG